MSRWRTWTDFDELLNGLELEMFVFTDHLELSAVIYTP